MNYAEDYEKIQHAIRSIAAGQASDKEIKQAIKRIVLMTGTPSRAIEKDFIDMLVEKLRSNHPNIRLLELELAFDFAYLSKLSRNGKAVELTLYDRPFSYALVAEVLAAYIVYKQEVVRMNRSTNWEDDRPKMPQEEQDRIIDAAWKRLYLKHKEGHTTDEDWFLVPSAIAVYFDRVARLGMIDLANPYLDGSRSQAERKLNSIDHEWKMLGTAFQMSRHGHSTLDELTKVFKLRTLFDYWIENKINPIVV